MTTHQSSGSARVSIGPLSLKHVRACLVATLFICSILFYEFGFFGRPLRVDFGSLAYGAFAHPVYFFMLGGSLVAHTSAWGLDQSITPLLLLTPFLSFSFGRTLKRYSNEKLTNSCFLVISMLSIAQIVAGDRLIPFYKAGTNNQLVFSGLSSEPSFSAEILFALMLIGFCGKSKRIAFLQAVFLGVFFAATGINTALQNLLVIACCSIICFFDPRPRFLVPLTCALFPFLLILVFPDHAITAGNYCVTEFGSWRQLGNILAITEAGLTFNSFGDYQAVVGEALVRKSDSRYEAWFSSAFSWFPFTINAIGKIGATLYICFAAVFLRRVWHSPYLIRVSALSCIILFLYTSPKWLMLYVVALGFAYQSGALAQEHRGGPHTN